MHRIRVKKGMYATVPDAHACTYAKLGMMPLRKEPQTSSWGVAGSKANRRRVNRTIISVNK